MFSNKFHVFKPGCKLQDLLAEKLIRSPSFGKWILTVFMQWDLSLSNTQNVVCKMWNYNHIILSHGGVLSLFLSEICIIFFVFSYPVGVFYIITLYVFGVVARVACRNSEFPFSLAWVLGLRNSCVQQLCEF